VMAALVPTWSTTIESCWVKLPDTVAPWNEIRSPIHFAPQSHAGDGVHAVEFGREERRLPWLFGE
jgi:hypothetical protein